jgi:hypothetical protein
MPAVKAMLRIRDIMVRLRIRISDLQIRIPSKFFAYYFLKVHIHHVSKIKNHKKVTEEYR